MGSVLTANPASRHSLLVVAVLVGAIRITAECPPPPFGDRLATAECVGPRPPCEALAGASVVALVDVVEAVDSWEKVGATASPVPQVVKLRVVESFKGVSPQQREITGRIHHNAESVFLDAGKRYLLYAYKRQDGTWTTSCSRTKLVQDASAELRQLRRCVKK